MINYQQTIYIGCNIYNKNECKTLGDQKLGDLSNMKLLKYIFYS